MAYHCVLCGVYWKSLCVTLCSTLDFNLLSMCHKLWFNTSHKHNFFLFLRSRYCWHDLQDCLSFLVNMTFLVIIAYWAEELFVSSDIVVLPKRCCRFWWCHHFGSNFSYCTTGRTKNIRIKNIRLKECYCGMNSNFWDGL